MSALAKEFPDAEIILHKDDEEYYYGLPNQPLMMGLQPQQLAAMGMDYEDPPPLTRSWQHNENYEVGKLRFSIRHCPGHTSGHVVLVEETEKVVFVGDCLFLGSIGRSDLPGGDHDQLIESINTQIMSLNDETAVYPGHGPETTVGHERANNPFLTGRYQVRGSVCLGFLYDVLLEPPDGRKHLAFLLSWYLVLYPMSRRDRRRPPSNRLR